MSEAVVGYAPDPGQRALQVSELHGLMDAALRQAGLHQVTITGVVSGLRVGPRFTNFELAEHDGASATPNAVLAVGVFAREFRAITGTLAAVGWSWPTGWRSPSQGGWRSTPATAASGCWPMRSMPASWRR